MTSECSIKSFFCAPCRWITTCCSQCRKTTVNADTQEATSQISIAVLGKTEIQIPMTPTHHRERTWKLSNGRMGYEQKEIGAV